MWGNCLWLCWGSVWCFVFDLLMLLIVCGMEMIGVWMFFVFYVVIFDVGFVWYGYFWYLCDNGG